MTESKTQTRKREDQQRRSTRTPHPAGTDLPPADEPIAAQPALEVVLLHRDAAGRGGAAFRSYY